MKLNLLLKTIVLFILGICIYQNSFAQENYLQGHIISLKGDTIHGYIDYRNWNRNPQQIHFKKKITSEAISYSPSKINSFSVNNENYMGAVVKIETSPHKTSSLESDPRFKFETDTCFLQVIVHGMKSLYRYKNSNWKVFFYIKQGSDFNLLEQKKYLRKLGDRNEVKENKRFLGQLAIYFNDCSSIQAELKNTVYSRKSLVKLFNYYYETTHSLIKFTQKTEKISFKVGALAGFSSTQLDISSDGIPYLANSDYSKSQDLTFGLFLNMILPKSQKKWSIYNELLLSSYEVKGESKDFYSLYQTELAYRYLKLNNMVRYTQAVKNMSVFFNIGISNGVAIDTKNRLVKKSIISENKADTYGLALDETRKYEQGLLVGIGTQFKKYGFEIRYENSNGMSNLSNLSSKVKRFYFLLSYQF